MEKILVIGPWYDQKYCILDNTMEMRQLLQKHQQEYGTELPGFPPTPGRRTGAELEAFNEAAKKYWSATYRLFESGEFDWKPLPRTGDPISLDSPQITCVVLVCSEW